MIKVQTKIHDKYSIEFKLSYGSDKDDVETKLSMNTWIFIPSALDINNSTYSKSSFYKDLRSNIRFITPTYTLNGIVSGKESPLSYLKNSLILFVNSPSDNRMYDFEYNVKMFCAICKSAIRDHCLSITSSSDPQLVDKLSGQLLKEFKRLISEYRKLKELLVVSDIPHEAHDYYAFGDEFISNLLHRQLSRVLKYIKGHFNEIFLKYKDEMITLFDKEIEYRKARGYPVIERLSSNGNRDLVYRSGLLKKYVESELFLYTDKKKDGILVEQIYLSIAAGISMIFATIIAFSFQQRYGNFTMPLFVALVVGYMLKDRIKELMRYYFAYRLKDKYYDFKTKISIGKSNIGIMKEGVDFIKEEMVPAKVISIRGRTPLLEADNRMSQEKIILYRKVINIDRKELDVNSSYYISGLNEILRYNLSQYIRKMDDPEISLFVRDQDGDYNEVPGSKIYYLNFIMQLKSADKEYFKRYRVIFNREGIKEIKEEEYE